MLPTREKLWPRRGQGGGPFFGFFAFNFFHSHLLACNRNHGQNNILLIFSSIIAEAVTNKSHVDLIPYVDNLIRNIYIYIFFYYQYHFKCWINLFFSQLLRIKVHWDIPISKQETEHICNFNFLHCVQSEALESRRTKKKHN